MDETSSWLKTTEKLHASFCLVLEERSFSRELELKPNLRIFE